MGSKHIQKKRRLIIVDGDADRLSSLPDDLIHKIFFSYSTKDVVRTSVLSSRWRFIWTSIPCLNLSTQDFPTLTEFSEFVRHVLSRRNNKIDVSSIMVSFHGDLVDQAFVKDIMEYAFYYCRNIQQLKVLYRKEHRYRNDTTLQNPEFLLGKSSWDLPALTTLYLQYVDLSNDENTLFSKYANLKNLTLEHCGIVGPERKIFLPRLSNLTLEDSFSWKIVNVVAPKLENLTIRCTCYACCHYVTVSAPDLASFVYISGHNSLHLSTDGNFNSLKEANIDVRPTEHDFRGILGLLEHLHDVKFLTLNMEVLEFLSSYVEQILDKPAIVFNNLKRLKIRPRRVYSQYWKAPNKSYYIDSPQGATLEEIVAQSIVVEFSVLLEQYKTDIKTNMTQIEQGKDAKMLEEGKSQAETNLQIGQSVKEKIESYWDHLCKHIDESKSKYCLIISKLQKIKEVLEKLPASKRALIQPSLASLYAEAVIVMGGITDLIKTQCDEKESRLSVCVQELATTLNPSY